MLLCSWTDDRAILLWPRGHDRRRSAAPLSALASTGRTLSN